MKTYPSIIIYRKSDFSAIRETFTVESLELLRRHLKPEFGAMFSGEYLAEFNRRVAQNEN